MSVTNLHWKQAGQWSLITSTMHCYTFVFFMISDSNVSELTHFTIDFGDASSDT